jgi:hypothetical protein
MKRLGMPVTSAGTPNVCAEKVAVLEEELVN